MKLAFAQRNFNFLIRDKLCGVESADGTRVGELEWGLGLESDELLPGQRARRLARILHRDFNLRQIVTSGMQVEIGQEFTLPLRKLSSFRNYGRSDLCHAQPFGRRAHGIAIRLHVLNLNESLLLKRSRNRRPWELSV